MNSSEAAAKLGTTPKELRRFLRADPSYTNASNTSSGRYGFSDQDFPTLQRRFTAWQSKNAGRKRRSTVSTATPAETVSVASKKPKRRVRANGAPGLPTEILDRRLYTSERDRVARLSRERVERLENQLMAAGLHVSQMRDREVS
jgi:hypothetical protein